MVSTSRGKKGTRSPNNQLSQGTSTPLPAHSVPRDSRVPFRLKQHVYSGSKPSSLLPPSRCEPRTLWSRRHFDPRGQDSLEQRLGISLPHGRGVRDCRRRARAANVVQSCILSGGKSRGLRTLAWSQLGLDCWAGDLPFSFQHWPAHLHLWIGFPDLKSKSLVSTKGIQISILALAIDCVLLSTLVNYWPAEIGGLLLLSSIVVALLVVAAKKLPADFLKSVRAEPRWRPRAFFLLGASFFPIWLLAGGFAAGANLFPPIIIVFDIIVSLWILRLVFRSMGTRLNQTHKVAFAFGLISPIIIFGIAASASFPLVMMNDVLVILFSKKMWTKWKAWTFTQHYSLMQGLPKLGGDGSSMP